MQVRYTEHAEDVITERKLSRHWIVRTLAHPERVERPGDGTIHHLARIAEQEDRVLRVVVDPERQPPLVVTAFFDRRMKGKLP